MLTSKEKSDTKRLPMMPIRDVVIFPYMMTPFVVGRESSVRALEEAMAGRQENLSRHPARRLHRRTEAQRNLQRRHDRQHRAEPETAGWQHQGPGGRRRARQSGLGDRRRRLLPRHRSHFGIQGGDRAAARCADQPRHGAVRAVRQAQPEPELRDDDRGHPGGRSGQAGRYRGRQSPAHHRREAGAARNLRSDRPPDARGRDARYRDREAERRPHHPGPREAPDGKGAERVLPQREDQGHPEGTGARREERDRRAEEAHRNRRHDAGRAREGHGRVEAAGEHAADVGRIHRLAQLSRLAAGGAVEEEIQGNPRPQVRRAGARERSLRPGEDQGAHPRIPGGAPPGEESQGLDPLLRRTSRRGQDVARHVDREGHRPQVRPHVARRRAR